MLVKERTALSAFLSVDEPSFFFDSGLELLVVNGLFPAVEHCTFLGQSQVCSSTLKYSPPVQLS